jgi:hypothetical protein
MTQPFIPDGLEMQRWIYRPDGTAASLILSWESFIDFLDEEFVWLDDEFQQDDPQERDAPSILHRVLMP